MQQSWRYSCAVSPSGVSAAVAATVTPTLPRPQPATATTASHCDSSVPRRRLFRRRHHRRSCPSQASATGGVATACAMLQTWKAASESTPGAMSRARPVWSASVAQATGWPRLAEAWGGLVHGLALKEASGEPAGRSLSHLVFDIGLARRSWSVVRLEWPRQRARQALGSGSAGGAL